MPNHKAIASNYIVGVEVGDRFSYLCVLDAEARDPSSMRPTLR